MIFHQQSILFLPQKLRNKKKTLYLAYHNQLAREIHHTNYNEIF